MTRKNDIRAIRVLAAIVVLLVLLSQPCKAQIWSWAAPTTDINDNPIARSNLYFKIYWGYDNSEWYFSTDYTDTTVDLSGVPAGCYYLYVSAVRTDTNPELESEPSESIHYCSAVELAEPRAPTEANLE